MQISWHGQFTVKIVAKEGTIVLDPYAPSLGLSPFRGKADIVALTNPTEPDMSHMDGITDCQTVIDTPGEYSLKGFTLHNFSWQNEAGVEQSIMRWDIEGVSLLHLGAIEHIPADEIMKNINQVDIDILFVPVGGGTGLNTKDGLELVSVVEPRIVIPIHYKLPKLTEKLEAVDQFAKEMGVSPSKGEKKIIVRANRLPQDDMQTIILQP